VARTFGVLAFILFAVRFENACADTYPPQLTGAWGGRAEHQGDDNPVVAFKACDSYKKSPQSVIGDVLVFPWIRKIILWRLR
jgi:hypothetical protein